MSGQEIRNIFQNNVNNEDIPSMSLITEIGTYVPVNIKIDEAGMNYYYSIDILEISKSDIDDKLISKMKQGGWQVSKDRKNLVKMC